MPLRCCGSRVNRDWIVLAATLLSNFCGSMPARLSTEKEAENYRPKYWYAAANLHFISCMKALFGGRRQSLLYMAFDMPSNISDSGLLCSDWTYCHGVVLCPGSNLIRVFRVVPFGIQMSDDGALLIQHVAVQDCWEDV